MMKKIQNKMKSQSKISGIKSSLLIVALLFALNLAPFSFTNRAQAYEPDTSLDGTDPDFPNNLFGLDFMTDFMTRWSITHRGNVGIGTKNPQARLNIWGGNLRVESAPGVVNAPGETNYNTGAIEFNGALMPWNGTLYNAGNAPTPTDAEVIVSQGAGVSPLWTSFTTLLNTV